MCPVYVCQVEPVTIVTCLPTPQPTPGGRSNQSVINNPATWRWLAQTGAKKEGSRTSSGQLDRCPRTSATEESVVCGDLQRRTRAWPSGLCAASLQLRRLERLAVPVLRHYNLRLWTDGVVLESLARFCADKWTGQLVGLALQRARGLEVTSRFRCAACAQDRRPACPCLKDYHFDTVYWNFNGLHGKCPERARAREFPLI